MHAVNQEIHIEEEVRILKKDYKHRRVALIEEVCYHLSLYIQW